MTEPIVRDHVARPPMPWRPTPTLTGCGRPLASVDKFITRAEFDQRLKTLGYQRTGLVTCMTCTDTERRWPTFEADPVQALARETERWNHRELSEAFRLDLVALAMLVEAHADEYAELRTGLDNTISLAEVRRRRRRGA